MAAFVFFPGAAGAGVVAVGGGVGGNADLVGDGNAQGGRAVFRSADGVVGGDQHVVGAGDDFGKGDEVETARRRAAVSPAGFGVADGVGGAAHRRADGVDGAEAVEIGR